jgi:DnaK suppressor protein
MENKEREKFKKKLLKLKEELRKFIETNEDYSQSDYSTDELDQATELIEKMTGFAVSSNFHHDITEVEEALLRIENHTYGKCLNCEKEIPLKRLQVLPFTKYCVECQQEIENINRNFG